MTYSVERKENTTPRTCRLKCSYCSACPHIYTSTCLDACTNTTVCEHMHLIQMQQPTNTSIQKSENKQNQLKYYIKVTNTSTTSPTTISLKHTAIIQTMLKHYKKSIYECLGSALGHVYDESTNPVVGLKKIPSHQNTFTQRRYQSMRKKKKVECKTFSKPTLNQVFIYQENLSKAEEEVCGVCFREDSHDIQQNINWIYIIYYIL